MKRLFAVCLSMAVVTGAFAAEPLKLRKEQAYRTSGDHRS